jgi:hypothetical protein
MEANIVSTLVVDLVFPAAPITTLLKRMQKGIEQFYYASLFVRSPRYEQSSIWQDWLDVGFHIAIVDAPPGTAPEDRIHLSLRFPSATPVVTIRGANAEALKHLQSLLELVDGVRPGLAGLDDDVKADALRSGPVADELVQPVLAALERHGLTEVQRDQYFAMLRRGFLALQNDSLKSMTLSLS